MKNGIKSLAIWLIIGVILIVVISSIMENSNNKMTYSELIENIEEGNVSSVKLSAGGESAKVTLNDNNKTIIIKDGDKTLIDQYSKEEDSATQNHTKTLIKENSTYLILPDRKEYYIYEGNNVDQTFLIDGIKEIMGKEYTKGTEKVKGKKYKYEEYSGSTMFLLSNSLNLDENDVKTRFYFDSKDNLVYIKTIYGDKHELLKVSLTNDIDSSVFEIPADYAEN